MIHTTACTYGLGSFSNCDFERQRNASRQSNFARARSRKRHQNEQDDIRKCTTTDDNHEIKAMQFIKRMRVSSPPKQSEYSNLSNQVPDEMLDVQNDEIQENRGEDMTESKSMNPSSARNDAYALVPMRMGNSTTSRNFESCTPVVWDYENGRYSFQKKVERFGFPQQENSACALIPIVQSRHLVGCSDLKKLSDTVPTPRVEMIEDDDIISVGVSSSTEDDTFCRFEEIIDDEEPMDLD